MRNVIKCLCCEHEFPVVRVITKAGSKSENGLFIAHDGYMKPIRCLKCNKDDTVLLPVSNEDFNGFGVVGKWSAQSKSERVKSLKKRARSHSPSKDEKININKDATRNLLGGISQ